MNCYRCEMRTIWEVVSKMYVGPFFEATPIVEGVFRCSEVGANNFPHRSHFFLISFSYRSQSAPVAIVRTLVVHIHSAMALSSSIVAANIPTSLLLQGFSAPPPASVQPTGCSRLTAGFQFQPSDYNIHCRKLHI